MHNICKNILTGSVLGIKNDSTIAVVLRLPPTQAIG